LAGTRCVGSRRERLVHKLAYVQRPASPRPDAGSQSHLGLLPDLRAYQLKPGKAASSGVGAHASPHLHCLAPALPRWIACWRGCMPIRRIELLMVLAAPEIRSTPNGSGKTTFACQVTRPQGQRRDAKLTIGGICRDASSSVSSDLRQARHPRSGITWAVRFKIARARDRSNRSTITSEPGCARLIGAGTNILFVSFT